MRAADDQVDAVEPERDPAQRLRHVERQQGRGVRGHRLHHGGEREHEAVEEADQRRGHQAGPGAEQRRQVFDPQRPLTRMPDSRRRRARLLEPGGCTGREVEVVDDDVVALAQPERSAARLYASDVHEQIPISSAERP